MNRGAMGNKWKLSKSNKPKTSNINKINQGFKTNQVLKTIPHLFNFTSFFSHIFKQYESAAVESILNFFFFLKIKARTRQYIYTSSMAKIKH